MFSSDSDGGGFRNSRIPLLSECLPLTKIWGRGALQGGGAEDCPPRRRTPKKGGFPPPHPQPPTDPTHTSAKRSLQCFCSWVFFFFSGFVPESADSAQLEAWLSYGLWGPGKPPSLGPLTPNPGSSSEPEVRFESGGIRPRGFRHQVSVLLGPRRG